MVIDQCESHTPMVVEVYEWPVPSCTLAIVGRTILGTLSYKLVQYSPCSETDRYIREVGKP